MSAGYMKKHFDSRGRSKTGFATQKDAEAFRTQRIASGAWRKESTNTYHCNYCGQYHAGHLGQVHRGKGRQMRKKGSGPGWHHTQ